MAKNELIFLLKNRKNDNAGVIIKENAPKPIKISNFDGKNAIKNRKIDVGTMSKNKFHQIGG